VPIPEARLLSISKNGDMAISIGHTFEGWMGEGTLARSSVLGSAPRPLLEHVREAEWNPEGTELAIVRRQEGLEQLEFPVGTVLYRTSGYISDVRFSPSGEHLAFADHHSFADDAGAVSIVDRSGGRTVLSEGWTSVRGLDWSPDGTEVWFTATTGGRETALHAVSLAGSTRVLLAGPVQLCLYDVAPDGRLLLGSERADRRVDALLRGWETPRDVSLRENSTAHAVAADGSALLISDQSTPRYEAYMLTADGTAPVRLGEGQGIALSPDLRWAATLPLTVEEVVVHPTGPGQSRRLPNPDNLLIDTLAWMDSQRIVMLGQRRGELSRAFVQSVDGGPPRPFTPPGMGVSSPWWALPVSSDGRIIARNEHGDVSIFFVDGRSPVPISGIRENEVPIQWTSDGLGLLVTSGTGAPRVVDRIDLGTGRRTRVLEITAREKAGLRLSIVAVSPDAKYYVHSYSRLLSDLYVVEGLK
jgi:dipeptidyl aminopeptidase/acylaminoacyl peptidase